MVRIGVFGLMGSGKSTVAGLFRDRGATVVDGDVLGWGVLRETPIVKALATAFGPGILAADGNVNRPSLGAIVFADPAAMERLNAIVQPRLLDCVREALERSRIGGAPLVLDAAMLTTWGIEPELDGVVHVVASERARIERLQHSRGFDVEEATERVTGQTLPPPRGAKKLWTIENDSDLHALRKRAGEVWNEIKELTGG